MIYIEFVTVKKKTHPMVISIFFICGFRDISGCINNNENKERACGGILNEIYLPQTLIKQKKNEFPKPHVYQLWLQNSQLRTCTISIDPFLYIIFTFVSKHMYIYTPCMVYKTRHLYQKKKSRPKHVTLHSHTSHTP